MIWQRKLRTMHTSSVNARILNFKSPRSPRKIWSESGRMCQNSPQVKSVDIRQYTIEYAGLAQQFRVNPDSCDNPEHYQDYLKYAALSDRRQGMAVTYVLLELINEAPTRIIGFVAFKASSLLSSDEGKYLGTPALEISELAVDADYEHQGYGNLLIDFAVDTANHLRRDTLGIRNVVLMADPKAVGFYSRYEPHFMKIGDWYAIPYEHWNQDCVGMFIRLPELNPGE